MKRNLHFYVWLAAVMMMMCSTATMSAQTKVTSLSQLKAGSVIKIYPKESDGTSHYGETSLALACSGNQNSLTSYEKAGSGDSWTIVDAGDGYYYLENDKGCYWAYQSKSSTTSLTCTASQSSAVKVSLTWDSNYGGVCFWNKQDGTGLNNLNGYNYRYNWWSSKSDYASDANTTFDVSIVSEGSGEPIKEKITKLSQLKMGSVIKIYPMGSDGTSHFGEKDAALACSGSGESLQTYNLTRSGCSWTLVDAGDGYAYLKNEVGCYWTNNVYCSISESSAAKVSMEWNSSLKGVYFLNKKDRKNLSVSDSFSYYIWSSDAKTTFEIEIVEEGTGATIQPVSHVAEKTTTISYNNLTYELNLRNKTAKVIANNYQKTYPETKPNIVIPEKVTDYGGEDYKVIALGEGCFENWYGPKSVTLPEGIVSLEDRCFKSCEWLEKVNLPESLTSLGSECFAATDLSDVVIPKGITSLGSSCFFFCRYLRSVTLPEGITTLGESCFDYCSGLTSVALPKGITTLGASCFSRCSKLTSITLPEGITTLGASCFSDCSSLTSITLPSTLKNIGSRVLYGVNNHVVILSFATLPPYVVDNSINSNSRVFVPKESIEKYKAASGWKNVYAINPLYPSTSMSMTAEATIVKTKTTTLDYTVLPENAGNKNVVWKSENPDVASVDDKGVITGVKVGTAKIVATTEDGMDVTASATITVLPLSVSDFIPQTTSVPRSIPTKVEVAFTPVEADNQKLKWTSLTPEIATVAEDGTVTGLKIGTAQLKAETTDGSNISKTFEVRVSAIDFAESNVSVVKTKSVTVKMTSDSEKLDKTKIQWTSSDEDVATVIQNVDADYPLSAQVIAHKVGKTTIKAEYGDGSEYSATCEVEVTPLLVSDFKLLGSPVIAAKNTITSSFPMEFIPSEADNTRLKWTSLTPEIATVTETGGVTGLKMGTARLKAETTDGSNISKTFDIRVAAIEFAESNVSVVKTKSVTVKMTSDSEKLDKSEMQWTSSDEDVATVIQNVDADYPLSAQVIAHKVGKTIIKAEYGDGLEYSATCEVEVTPLMVGDFTTQTNAVVKTIPTEMKMEVTPTEADNKKLKWTSLLPEIATVTEDGSVTGQKMGTATLKATTTDGSNISKMFEVQVLGLSVSSISMPKEASITKTDKQKLLYSVLPAASDNQTLKWSSKTPAVASVDETTGIITAKEVGDAVITATATDGSGVSASTTIHVTPLKVSHINIPKELSLLRTMTGQVEATVEPELADNKVLKWESDNEDIVTVTQEGVVKGVNVGSANITATATDGSSVSATCLVTVSPVTIDLSTKTINLRKGESYSEQMVNVLPSNYEHKDVSWSSTDNSVASVNADGVITAVKPGITTIKYVLDYDNNITSECKVIVYEDNVVYVGGIYYILDKESKEATVTSIYGGKNTSLDATKVAQYYSGTINIPETIIYDGDKYTVKKVGSYAFNCQNELQSIIVPRTVTMIQDNAAIHAENLNRVNVANESQLVSIGKQAFMECTGLKRFTFDGTSLSMNLIDKEAFKNCTALERVTWMDDTSIKTIGNSAFYGCSALEKVQWMKKSELKTIQDYAFFKCASLNNFEMPNTTLSVGNSSFRYNSSLTNIHLSTSLNYIDEYAFGECGFSQITLPESLANIQAGAFINNEHLQEITLPERLQGLGSAAFENNSALESVTFKTAIETMTIGNNAFNQCPILNKVYITNLNSFAQTNFNNAKANPANTSQHIYDANGNEIINVVLPKGTKYVNNNAFNGCAYIKSIEMPATMDHVNDDIFYGCSGLKDVYCYAEDVPDFIGVNDPSSMDAVFKQATLHVPFGSEAKYQKDTEWWGRFGSIQGCDPQPTQVVTQIDLSTRTVNLKAGTTYNEQKITVTPAEAANVRIKYSTADRNVADIDEDGVIHGVAAGVTTITYTANDGSGVTAECKVIVREPEVEYVGDLYYLFDKAKKQATVTSIYGGKNTSLDAEKVAQYYTGTVNIPEQTTFDAVTYDVKAIGGYAFTCQNDLQALRVGAFVEEIADNAATKAQNLNRITVANASQLKNIGKEAFMDCTGLQHVLFEGTTQSMEAINTAAFKNCTALQDVIWEGKSTLNLIGNSAFYGCSKLETVKWNDLCTLQVIDDYAFYQCSSLNHFIMPNSTLSVGKYSFRYDAALTDISLSTSLSIIYDYAFGECGFTQIVLPESLKSLQAGAFINNSYLADITIPKKLEGIGAGAFENNDALETVTFKTHETKLTVDKNAFNCCPVLSKVNIDYLDDWAHINFQNAAANPASTAHRLYLNNVEIIDVNLPSGTKYIGNNVFNGCSNIRTLTVPATVEHINDNIIYGCSALRDVYCYAAKVPQFIGTEDASAMSDVFSQATLHVIYGNEAAYKADSWWGRFYKVEGCNAPSDTDVKVSSITISQTEATLKPDDTMQLEATVYPTNAANKKINWSSSNEDVAQVTEDGFVLAITEGEADITAEAADGSGIKAVCHITVENEKKPVVPIVGIKFEQSSVTIALGESFKLNVIFNPANASNKQLTWTSTRPAVATVDREGNVYGVAEGKTIITAKSTDGSNLTINCAVTVSKTTGIGNITMGDVKMILDKRHLKVEGLADNDIVQIVNTIGFTVYKGTEHEVDLDAPGIYIIKVKGKTLKFSVK